jgi:tRNA (guanosine-2'-O-)-methyltransferase
VATALILYEAQRQRDAAGMYEECRIQPEEVERLRFEWAYPSLAARLRRAGRAYPKLDDDGRILRA